MLLQRFYRLHQLIRSIRFFPRHGEIFPAHMAVRCQLPVDGPAQPHRLNNRRRPQVKHPFHRLGENLIGYGAGAGVTAAGVFADIMSIANV